MLETSVRLLRLLSLLQARPDWSGAELAERLGVTTRTVRNDIRRLRSLGYQVQSAPGTTGGYRLGAGAALPPLLLDDEEAIAVAVGLHAAAGGTVTGIEEASLRALTKLRQLLPSRLRHRTDAVRAATDTVASRGPTVDAETLTVIAAAIRDREGLRFDYLDHDGTASRRSAEPHRLVFTGRRWYLVAWDDDRDDWRTFRADRIRPGFPTAPASPRARRPGATPSPHVVRGAGSTAWPHPATVRLHAPAKTLAEPLPPGRGAAPARQQAHQHPGDRLRFPLWPGRLPEQPGGCLHLHRAARATRAAGRPGRPLPGRGPGPERLMAPTTAAGACVHCGSGHAGWPAAAPCTTAAGPPATT